MLLVSAASRIAAIATRLATVADALATIKGELASIDVETERGALVQWLSALNDAVEHMQLDCADARFAARELRDVLPGTETVQPRLL